MTHRRNWRCLLCAAAILTVLAGCQTVPVYRPAATRGAVGFRDEQLTANRYRVTFSGSADTSRDQVEDYLMRRAAEVTREQGYMYFVFDDRHTEAKTYYRAEFDPLDRWPWWHYGPGPFYWSRWGYPGTWHGWYGPWGDEWTELAPITRYTAHAEVVMLTPAQAAKDPNAIDAQEVLNHLAPAGSTAKKSAGSPQTPADGGP